MDDERVSTRVIFSEPLSALLYLDSDEAVFLSTDASKMGLRIESGVAFEIGARIKLVYDLIDDRFIEGEGTIKWNAPRSDGRFDLGIEFSHSTHPAEFAEFAEHDRQLVDRRSAGADENRIYPRSEQSTKVYSGGIATNIYDLSEAGCCMLSERSVEPGKFVALVFSTPNEVRIKIHGKIKWCRQDEVSSGMFQHGVEIWHINEACRASYEELLQDLSR